MNLLKKIFSDKILLFLNFIIIIIIFFLFNKFVNSDSIISGFYLNFIIYFSIFFVISFIVLVQKFSQIKLIFKIIILSIILSLYTVEIYLNYFQNTKRAIEDLQNRKIYADKLGQDFDTRSKYEVLKELRARSEIVYPTIPPNDIFTKTSEFFKEFKNPIYPLANISNSKLVFCNESGKRIIYKSDRYGFRNKDKIWDENEVDIVIVGDSLVHGACVDDEYVTSNLLAKISGKKVLNLGTQGHGPLLQLAALKEYAFSKKPKVILWYYSEANDLSNLMYEMKFEKIEKYINKSYSQDLLSSQSLIDKQLIKLVELVKNSEDGIISKDKKNEVDFISLVKLTKLRAFSSLFFPENKSLVRYKYSKFNSMDEYFKVLKIANNLVKSWDGELIFVYHPHLTRYMASYAFQHGERQYVKFIKSVKSLNIRIIDLKKILFDDIENPKSLYHFGLPGHPSEYGYELTAKKFNSFLKEE